MRPEFQELVHDFHVGIGGQKTDAKLRISLIQEEANELMEAINDKDVIAAIDAVCDLLYVIYGTADVYEIYVRERFHANPKHDPEWGLINKDLANFKHILEKTLKTIEITDTFNAKGKLHHNLTCLANEVWEIMNNLGVPLEPFFLEVHRTNMHKLTGPKREDGKQLKPPGWKPPRIAALYDRLQAGSRPDCRGESDCEESTIQCQPHPDGGMICGKCGGLIVTAD